MDKPMRLIRVENDHEITRETDNRFLLEYQRSVLLALKEAGTLNEAQYRCAEKILERQWASPGGAAP